MSRLSDPRLCPDCRTALRGTRCPACGLVLTGPLADRLWQEMLAADATITELRVAQPAFTPAAPLPTAPPLPASPRRTGLDGRTVPVVLLTLGGLLVFVAVSLFLAVTWSDLPLALKALIMVAVTTAVGVGAATLTRKNLPGAAETVWALTAALLALDLSAAWRSDLAGLHAVPVREMTAASGLVVAVLGVVVSLWSRRTPVGGLVSPQVAAGLGIAVVTFSELVEGQGARPAVGVVLLAAAAYVLHRFLPALAYAVAALGVLVWLDLLAIGGDVVEAATGHSAAWAAFAGWPLVVAATLAAVVALLRPLPHLARTAAAVASLGSLAALAVLPIDFDTTTVLLGSAVLAALAGLALMPARTWSEAAAFLAGIGAVVAGAGSVLALAAAAANATDVLRPAVEPLGAHLPRPDAPAGWTLLVVAAVVLAAVYAVAGHFDARRSLRVGVLGAATAVLALAAAGAVLASPTPLWVAVLALVVTALVGFVPAVLDRRYAGGGGFGLYAVALAIVLATRSDLLTGAVGTAFAVVALAVTLRPRTSDSWWPVALGVAPLAATAGYGWGRTADLAATPLLVVLELLAAVVLVGAAWVTQGRRRLGLEVGAVATLVVLVSTVLDDPQLALGLSIAGSAVALLSVLHTDRRDAGWVASVVLALGTLVRFVDDAHAPELYALPAAAVLIAAGCYRLARDEGSSSWAALGSGLNLALVPSLLLALEEPASLRGLLVGVGALVALAVGIARRWQAPYLTGAAVLAALALRFLLPLARDVLDDPVGAWILFGTAGAALLGAGILWERSLRQLRSAGRYVGALV